LSTEEARDWRPLILLAVLLSHAVVVRVIIRTAWQERSLPPAPEPLILTWLHDKTAPVAHGEPSPLAARHPSSSDRSAKRHSIPGNTTPLPPAAPIPPIDWQHEAELATEGSLANCERDQRYRDLSALSPAQLNWIKQNRMQPMPPGIEWNHPRVEFDRNSGLPMLWINDHCVLITLIVFCGVGHIEPNGDLFKHMRDRRDP